MPVGYNIAANQRFPDAQAALKGKALRAGLETERLSQEATQQQIDMAPEDQAIKRAQADVALKNVQLRQQELAIKIDEENSKLTEQQRAQQAEVWTAGKQAFEKTGDPEAATKAMQIKADGKLPKGAQYDDFAADAILANYENFLKGGTSPKQHVNYYNPDTGDRKAVRPDSPEADALAAQGYLVGSNSDKVLGLGESEGGSPIKAADESYILRLTAQHFGGLYDESTGQVAFTDPSIKRRASQVIALASNLFHDEIAETRSDAVKKALKAYGEKWEDPGEKSGFDVEAAALDLNVSIEDLEFTAKSRNMSVEDVYKLLKK